MASGSRKRRRHTSAVGDVIKFDPENNPEWRKEGGEPVPSVTEMIKDIVGFQEQWNSMKENSKASAVHLQLQRQFLEKFLFHCNKEEDHGCGTLEATIECLAPSKTMAYSTLSTEQKETVDLKEAYEYLLNVKERESDLKSHGMIEESMLRDAHKLILKTWKTRATKKQGETKPGCYSDKRRFTTFAGERYEYQYPPDMHSAVNNILDKFNSLFEDSQPHNYSKSSQETLSQTDQLEDEETRMCNLYKTCGWLVFQMLDLHPFGDGNGRLCRLLCSYVLSTCTPFPTPIYNIWSTSCKMDYQKALVAARKSETRHPRALVTMIIECSWHGWKEFLRELHEGQSRSLPLNMLKEQCTCIRYRACIDTE